MIREQRELEEKLRKDEEIRGAKSAEELRRREIQEPGKFSFDDSSDTLILAKTIFCEGEEAWEHPNYMRYIGFTPVVRSYLSGEPIKQIVSHKFESKKTGSLTYAYTFFNPSSSRRLFFDNPLRESKKYPEEIDAWQKAYRISEEILNTPSGEIDPELTHFYVDTVNEPRWAKGKKPKEVIKYKGKTTRFYYIPENA